VLSTISRKAGRATRRACHLLSYAYGPLDCGLRLDGSSSVQQLLSMTAHSSSCFEHVTCLVLTAPIPPPNAAPLESPAGSLPTLCAAMPKLASLRVPITIRDLNGLAGSVPLLPRLTSLALPSVTFANPGLPSLELTRLHSVVLPLHAWATPSTLQVLSSFHRLRALEWLDGALEAYGSGAVDPAPMAVDAERYFTPLRVLSDLTSLLIRPGSHTWDQAALDTLRTGFPMLAALALNLKTKQPHGDDEEIPVADEQAPIAALAARTALTSLQLDISGAMVAPAQQKVDLRCMSSLWQLRELTAVAEARCSFRQILDIMMTATALTSLHLAEYIADQDRAAWQCFAALAGRLKALDFTHMAFQEGASALHLACLTRITNLRLANWSLPLPDQQVEREVLGRMRYLEVLQLSWQIWHDSVPRVLCGLAGLSRLQDLASIATDPS
jgi:hypothetical protein